LGDVRCIKYTYGVSPTSAFGTFITQIYQNHNLLLLQAFADFFFPDMILATCGALEHDLFIYPLITYFGFCFLLF